MAALLVLFLAIRSADAEDGSVRAASDGVWRNAPLAAPASTAAAIDAIASIAVVELEVDVQGEALDGLVALSGVAGHDFADYAAILRFNDQGLLDVRDGSAYAADRAVAYRGGERFGVRMLVDVPARRYSVWVRPYGRDGTTPSGEYDEVTVAANRAFRSEQGGVVRLANLGVWVAAGSGEDGALEARVTRITPLETSPPVWRETPLTAPQRGVFTVEFDASPLAAPLDGVIAFAPAAGGAYAACAALVRFNPAGVIDVRDGSGYRFDATVPYAVHGLYRIRMEVDVPRRRYSLWASEAGGPAVQVARDYAFRAEQAAAEALTHLRVISETGALALSSFAIKASEAGSTSEPAAPAGRP